MNSKMIAGGIALVFVAMALPSNAYHIVNNPAAADGAGTGQEPLEWGGAFGADYPVSDPLINSGPICPIIRLLNGLNQPIVDAVVDILCTDDPAFEGGESAFAFTACEANPTTTAVGRSGQGGLCFMNPGFTDQDTDSNALTPDVCDFYSHAEGNTNGRSNGFYNAYDGGVCKASTVTQTLIASPARQWYEIEMTNNIGNPVAFTAQIGGITCGDGNSSTFVYDDQFAYTIDGGHVTGFPTFGIPSGTFGTYKVGSTTNPVGTMTECSPYPMYY